MDATFFLLCYLASFATVTADLIGLQCFVPGECLDSEILTITTNSSATECLNHCQNVISCEWFTFYPGSSTCLTLSGCLGLDATTPCDGCISGEDQCPVPQCGVPGRCLGALEGVRKVSGEEECHAACQGMERCLWHSYSPSEESCQFTHDCPVLDKSCTNCKAWERSCINNGVQSSTTTLSPPSESSQTTTTVLPTTTETQEGKVLGACEWVEGGSGLNKTCPSIDKIMAGVQIHYARLIQIECCSFLAAETSTMQTYPSETKSQTFNEMISGPSEAFLEKLCIDRDGSGACSANAADGVAGYTYYETNTGAELTGSESTLVAGDSGELLKCPEDHAITGLCTTKLFEDPQCEGKATALNCRKLMWD